MFYVMSAECVDGGVEPFLHAICEDEQDAAAEVARVVKALDMEIVRGTNDCEEWAEVRYDKNGLLAWDRRDPDCMKSVIAKWVNMNMLGICR